MTEPMLRFPWEDPPSPADAIEVAEGIFWVRSPLPMRLDHVNCYVVDEGDHWTVIDTGLNRDSAREGWSALFDGLLGGLGEVDGALGGLANLAGPAAAAGIVGGMVAAVTQTAELSREIGRTSELLGISVEDASRLTVVLGEAVADRGAGGGIEEATGGTSTHDPALVFSACRQKSRNAGSQGANPAIRTTRLPGSYCWGGRDRSCRIRSLYARTEHSGQ